LLLAIALLIIWTVRYVARVRGDPALSLAPNTDPSIPATAEIHAGPPPAISRRIQLPLVLFGATFAVMIVGVSRLGWWFAEMTALFLGTAKVVGALQLAGGRIDTFIHGARDLLGVGLIIGLTRGITTILEGAAIDATIIDAATNLPARTVRPGPQDALAIAPSGSCSC